MRLPIRANDTGAIDGEHDRQFLDSDVMDNLIVGALQESRVNRHDGLIAANRRACGEGDGMLLGDGDVK